MSSVKIIIKIVFYLLFITFVYLTKLFERLTKTSVSFFLTSWYIFLPLNYILQYFGKFLPINKNKTIESVLAGSKLH